MKKLQTLLATLFLVGVIYPSAAQAQEGRGWYNGGLQFAGIQGDKVAMWFDGVHQDGRNVGVLNRVLNVTNTKREREILATALTALATEKNVWIEFGGRGVDTMLLTDESNSEE